MLDISQVRLGSVVKHDGAPYTVISAAQKQVGRGGSIKTIKIKNLIDGKVLEKTLQGNDKMDSADLARGKAQYLYKEGGEVHFMNNETFEQFSIEKENVGESINFLVEGADVTILYFEGNAVSVEIPIKAELTVTEAPPGVKGDTAGTATKTITLETGYQVNAPLFIKEGDKVRINTETGQYVERVKS
ncbi:elongation factor P [Candidatus Falkowbacteria bacterium]|nr:elongation factor P [Candidatus Falkowbacteria bacterium]